MTLAPREIKNLYEEAFLETDANIRVPAIEISFYPYVDVNSRIRSRDGLVSVRITELLRDAPREIHRALARMLVAKLLGRKVPPAARRAYREHVDTGDFRKKALAHRRRTGRKELTSPRGRHFDLEKIFHKLNLVYFQNELPKPVLSWSKRKTRRRLGHHDPAHEAIIISRSLDEPDVPRYVVEYVLYHEMLHLKHPVRRRNGRRLVHTPEFRRDEEMFPYFEDAEEWLAENARNIGRRETGDK